MLKHNNFIITEAQCRLINESAVGNYIDRLIAKNLPDNARQYAETTIGELVKKRPDLLSRLPLDTADEVLERFGNTKLKDFIRISIMRQFDMHGNAGSGKGPVKYMRGIFRIALDELKVLRQPDMQSLNRLKDNVLYIYNAASAGDNECLAVNGDLDGMSEAQVNDRFKEKRKAFLAALRDRVSKREVAETGHTYTKVPILKHDDAVPFQPYTEWCIAFTSSSNYDGYVQGGRRFYVFLRDDYKDFRKGAGPVGDNCPLDDYGMSMVSVLVNMDGGIDIITTRWNHAHDGEFNPPDEETLNTIQRLMGVNLFSECPPYSREELRKMGVIPFDEIQDELDSGVSPEDIFRVKWDAREGFSMVYVNGKWSFLNNKTNRLIGDGNQWFKNASEFFEGYARVQRVDGKWSLIDTTGGLIGEGNQWYKEVGIFSEGYAEVRREDGKWSFVDRNCKLIGDGNQWYKDVWSFSEDYAAVKRDDGKCSFIDRNGKLIGDENQWYKEVDHFHDGYAAVQRDDGKYSFIDRNGKLIGNGNQWYKNAHNFSEGYTPVQHDDGKWSFIDKNGKLIGDGNVWYKDVFKFSEGYAAVRREDWEWVYLSKRGNEFASKEEAQADSKRLAMAESVSRRFIITESQRHLINESAVGNYIDRLIANNLPENARQYADTTIGELVKKRPDILSRLPLDTADEVLERFGNTKLKDFIRISIMRQFDMHGNAGSGKGPVKYMRGIFRIVLDELKLLQRPDMNCINRLKDNVLYIMNAANDGDAECLAVDSDLNGMSEEQLDRTFRDKRKAFFAALRARMSGKKVGKASHKYTKVVINRHADAVPFQPYTKWCIAFTSSSNYDGYVQGGRRFYVFLRDDYKDFGKDDAPRGENCPLDDYGLSMVSVLVNMEGHIDIITTRWNHANDGEFNPPDEETLDTIQRAMGVNLYAECSPYSREELRKMGIIPFDEIQAELDRGISPKDIFKENWDAGEGFSMVYVNGKWSFLNNETNRLIGDGTQWYKGIWSFSEGYARVQRDDGKWSFIDTNGKFIGDGNQWYKYAYDFSEGSAVVQREDGKWSFIDRNCKLIGDGKQWYEEVYSFLGGYAAVQRKDGKYSFIDRDGKLIGDGNQWYENVYSFSEGYTKVQRDDWKWVYLSKRGNEFASKEEARADSKRLAMAESVRSRFIITESQRRLINESAVGNYIDKLIAKNLPDNARQYMDTTVGELVKSHPDILSDLPLDTADEVLEKFGNTKLKDFIRISIMRQFDMHGNAGSGKGPVKYMRGIFRIVLDELKVLRQPDMQSLNRLKDNVLYIYNAANAGDEECLTVNGDLDGMSESQVNDRFKAKRKSFLAALRDRVSKREVAKTGHTYTKVVINSHDDAVPFQPYTEWCIAFSDSSNYDGYVQGGRRFYVFLRDDYKNFRKGAGPVGDNCPLDDYGMSMVSVLVNMDGGIDIITTRWNHAHDGEFNPPDEETLNTIQRLMGVNLFSECPPYSREELRKMGVIPFDELQGELDRGVDPNELFKKIEDAGEGFSMVYVNGKYSLLNNETNRLIGDGNVWYEEVGYFHEGYAKVVRDDFKWSFIDRNGKLIGDGNQWYKNVGYFSEGYAEVQFDAGKWSFIDTNGKLIGDGNQWYLSVGYFSEGYAKVQRTDGKGSFIDKDGKLIGDGNQWYEWADHFHEGYAKVQREDWKCSFIDRNGKRIGDGNQWYKNAWRFSEGYAKVRRDDWKLVYLSKRGNEFASMEEARADSERYGMTEERNRMVMSEAVDEIESSEIDLSSFKENENLNGDLWNDDEKIDSKVRLQLLDIVDDFIDSLEVSWVKYEDIYLTGSMANYNWSEFSDIDIHVVYDFSKIHKRVDFVKDYFDAKKNLWNKEHDNITIYGHTVEISVEDSNSTLNSSGVFSLERNEWVRKPKNDVEGKIDYDAVREESARIITKIENISQKIKESYDSVGLKKHYDRLMMIMRDLSDKRKNSIKRHGEYGTYNIVYKVIRRAGLVYSVWELLDDVYDRLNSLPKVNDNK